MKTICRQVFAALSIVSLSAVLFACHNQASAPSKPTPSAAPAAPVKGSGY